MNNSTQQKRRFLSPQPVKTQRVVGSYKELASVHQNLINGIKGKIEMSRILNGRFFSPIKLKEKMDRCFSPQQNYQNSDLL